MTGTGSPEAQVVDSCGCAFCDLGLEPDRYEDGVPYHDTPGGSRPYRIRCIAERRLPETKGIAAA